MKTTTHTKPQPTHEAPRFGNVLAGKEVSKRGFPGQHILFGINLHSLNRWNMVWYSYIIPTQGTDFLI